MAVPTGEATRGTLDTSDIPGTGYARRPEVSHSNSMVGQAIRVVIQHYMMVSQVVAITSSNLTSSHHGIGDKS